MRKLMLTAQAMVLGLAGAASAQTMAMATTDLNVRSGPGAQYPVVGSIMAGGEVSVLGCIDGVNWCEVSGMNIAGWSYGDYLSVRAGDQIVSLSPAPARSTLGVAVVSQPVAPIDENPNAVRENAAVGGLGGAAIGALVAGPVGALVGAAIGGTTGTVAAYEPTSEVTTYVTSNVVEPVYLDGEVVIGAGVPETVTVYDVPMEPQYRYAVINGQTVLVDSMNRSIVYIYR